MAIASSAYPTSGATANVTFTNSDAGYTYTYSQQFTFTNLGPLTTTFKAPASCASSPTGTLLYIDNNSTGDAYGTFYPCGAFTQPDASITFSYLEDPNCLPSGSTISSLLEHNPNYATLFSPGLYCPSGWATSGVVSYAPSSTSISVNGSNSWPNWLTDTGPTAATQVYCCPSSWSLSTSFFQCFSQITTAHASSYCNFNCAQNVTTDTNGYSSIICPPTSTNYVWDPVDTVSSTTLAYFVPAISLVHQQRDIDAAHRGLSTDGTIAVAVVVPVVVLAALLAGMYFYLKRRKQKMSCTVVHDSELKAYSDEHPHDPATTGPTELSSTREGGELDGTSRLLPRGRSHNQKAELSAERPIYEAGSTDLKHELADTSMMPELAHQRRSTIEPEESRPDQPGDGNLQQQADLLPHRNNEAFERRPYAAATSQNSTERPVSSTRLTDMESESARLEDQIRRLHLEGLTEQKRRLDEQIAALRAQGR